ncbi:MAG: class I SAM-dependent methyltransferase [Betaproteobacteria bacterium]|nr:class I SAM-dependent methyltransferase [Betaproteobacteria bacterium]
MPSDLPFTGERFVPGAANAKGEMWYEHWHRYHYVLPLIAGKRVVDVACGEGYGSALMSGTAAEITGVDISADAIAHARNAYADHGNLKFIEGSCLKLPFDAASIDVLVSFETIEHIHEQAEFLDEIKRVLKPDGVLILSSPNKAEYSDKRGYANEFHVRELYRAELEALLASRFPHSRWISQRNAFVSLIAEGGDNAAGESLAVSQLAPDKKIEALPALYYLIFAGRDQAVIEALPKRVSAFTDAEEWAYNDYRETYRGFRHYMQREKELEAECARLRTELETRSNAGPTTAAATSDSWLARLIKRLAN